MLKKVLVLVKKGEETSIEVVPHIASKIEAIKYIEENCAWGDGRGVTPHITDVIYNDGHCYVHPDIVWKEGFTSKYEGY